MSGMCGKMLLLHAVRRSSLAAFGLGLIAVFVNSLLSGKTFFPPSPECNKRLLATPSNASGLCFSLFPLYPINFHI